MRRLNAYFTQNKLGRLAQGCEALTGLLQAWREAAPEALARQAVPLRYEQGVLHLALSSAAWGSRVRHQQGQLLQQLARHSLFADIQRLHLTVTPRHNRPAMAGKDASKRSGPILSTNSSTVISGAANSIKDPALKAAMQRLARQRGH